MRSWVFIMCLVGLSWVGFGAVLTLHDGSTISGRITAVTPYSIEIEDEFGKVEKSRDTIKSIADLDPSEKALLASLSEATDFLVLDGEREPQNGNAGKGELKSSAVQTLLLFKKKLEQRYLNEQNRLKESFAQERRFLEENLEVLAKRYSLLKEDYDKYKQKLSIQKASQEELLSQLGEAHNEVLKFKKELSFINEQRLKNEVATTERIQKEIARNKSIYEKEKLHLISSYEQRLNDLDQSLARVNKRVLELTKHKSDLETSLALMEKLADQNGVSLRVLEKEFKKYKEDSFLKERELKKQFKDDKAALEKMVATGAEALSGARNEIKMLKEEGAFLKDENQSLKLEIKALNRKVLLLEEDKKRFKEDAVKAIGKLRSVREEEKMAREDLLRSLVDSVLIESKVPNLDGLAKDVQKAILEVRKRGFEESKKERSTLFDIFKNDIKDLQSNIEEKQNKIEVLQRDNDSLSANVQKSQALLNSIKQEKEEMQLRARRMQEEKDSLKTDMESILEEIREESRRNIEKEKIQLRRHYEETITKLESRSNEVVQEVVPELESIEDFEQRLEEVESSGSEGISPISEEELYEPEQPVKVEEYQSYSRNDDVLSESRISSKEGVSLEVGSISQVEADFFRVYIDTTENLKKGDRIFLKNSDGDEVSLRVLKIFEELEGAIAEIEDTDKTDSIQLQDKVYIR